MITLQGKVLVVVDMQPGYRMSMNHGQFVTVRELVRAAREAECFIVFLEFIDEATYPELLQEVRAYDMFVREQKGACDGSLEVMAACQRGAYDMDTFVVCGVDTHACVHHTAQQLARRMPNCQVEVVMQGCGSHVGNDWKRFPKEPNLKLVSVNG